MLSITIITFNRWQKTKELLDSLNYLDCKNETIIVDNGSTDETLEGLKDYPNVILIKNETNQRLLADNQAFAIAKGEYILRLDNDVKFTSPFYDKFLRAINTKDVGLVVPLITSGGKHQKSDSCYNGVCTDKYKVGSSVWFFRRSLLEEIGNIDSRFSYYCNDVDFQMRVLQRGYKIAIAGEVLVQHDNVSSLALPENETKTKEAMETLYKKWGSLLTELYGYKDKETFAESIVNKLEG